MILGTAGHIDHGKTTLVRALTGVDTDRLPEEKRRGITIELGFAPLVFDGIGTVGVVDVPGHEAFVRTMVAGATGIDLALVVIAADEGVMPQTREHLAILELLGVSRGVVALTKADLVDDEWLALVEEDVREATARALPEAPIIAASAVSGQGIQELRSALERVARQVPPRAHDDLFRLPVDRAFTIKGTGTVVTGTVWSGHLQRDETVRILPSDRSARVRGIQGHGRQQDAAQAGARAAVALAGVETSDVPRGSTLVVDKAWHPTMFARADVSMVVDADLRPRAWLRFHVGTTEVGARVVARQRGAAGPFGARVVFDQPVVLRAGDRFVLRTTSPLNTIAGGVITDPYAPPRARPWGPGLSALERLQLLLAESGAHGLERSTLPVRLGLAEAAIDDLLGALDGSIAMAGAFVVPAAAVEGVCEVLQGEVRAYHDQHPLEFGMPAQLLRTRVRAAAPVIELALERSVSAGALTVSAGAVAEPGWRPSPTDAQERHLAAIFASLERSGAEPPDTSELSVEIGADAEPLLKYLERRGDVVQVEQNRYYTTANLTQVIERLRSAMSGKGEMSPSELRDALGLSRKYLIPFLEYCDRAGYTNRNTSGRVWRGT
ncbi:MAG TPA: selenocysteine-specific translation elongation factor [Gemmatimonadaceae bacterium]|nr:selenocysteine-specific translation elongation factor [Gemmatimonadaceae bacterium]